LHHHLKRQRRHACSAVDDAHRGSVHDDRRYAGCGEQPHNVGFALTLQTRGFAPLQQCHRHRLDRDIRLQPPKRGTLLAVMVLGLIHHEPPCPHAVPHGPQCQEVVIIVTQIEGTAGAAKFFIPLASQLETIIRLPNADSHKMYACLIFTIPSGRDRAVIRRGL